MDPDHGRIGRIDRPVLIHIGYHKTASTWLQTVFFPLHPQLAYVVGHDEAFGPIVEPHDLDFDEAGAREALRPTLEGAGSRLAVVSAERLCGAPLSGGRDSRVVADRLARLFPAGRVLVFVREQISAIVSTYRQYVLSGGIGSLERFLDPPPSDRYGWFDPRHFHYDRLVEHYRRRFDAERVKVIPYERFRRDNQAVCDEICRFCGVPRFELPRGAPARINPSLSGSSLALLRRVNRCYRSSSNPWAALHLPLLRQGALRGLGGLDRIGGRAAPRIEREVRRRFAGSFAGSNRALEALIGEALNDLGYE